MTVNKVTLLGVLGDDPQVKTMPKGNKLVTFKLMTTEKGKDRDFNQWHSVAIWSDKLGELVQTYAKKGSQIYLEGKLTTRSYEQNGQTRYVTEVQVGPFGGEIKLLGTGAATSVSTGNTGNNSLKAEYKEKSYYRPVPRHEDAPYDDSIEF